MSKTQRIKITHIHEGDAYYSIRNLWIGLTGNFKRMPLGCGHKGYFAGGFTPDSDREFASFHAIRYIKI